MNCNCETWARINLKSLVEESLTFILVYYWLLHEKNTSAFQSCSCQLFSDILRRAASAGPDSGCFVWWAGQERHSLVDPRERGLVWKANESRTHRGLCGYVRLVLQEKKTCISIRFLCACVHRQLPVTSSLLPPYLKAGLLPSSSE